MSRVRAYLQLMRLPALFTAMADIFLGFLLNHRAWGDAPLAFGLLLTASSCLYLAGMVFNDVFDRQVDAVERPQRPIPSGRVSLRAAGILGMVLVVGGIVAALLVGAASWQIAVALTLCIFAYDGWLKRTPLGPLAMGTCRFLNVMLGASAVAAPQDLWTTPVAWPALGLGVYVAGITWFARSEAGISSRWHLLGAQGLINVGFAALVAFVMAPQGAAPSEELHFQILLTLALFVVIINRRLVVVAFDPMPQKVQAAVKSLLFSLVLLDAILIFNKTGDTVATLATAALLIPALLIGRWLYVT